MAREGLRTLVVAKKVLSEEQYSDFEVIAKLFFSLKFNKKKTLNITFLN